MKLVSDKEEIYDNVEVFLEGLELGDLNEKEKSLQLIKKSNTFLVVDIDGLFVFVPNVFIGYKENNLQNIETNLPEKEVNVAISKILGSSPKIDKIMDEHFLDFCDELEINRNDVGLSREYWIIKNLD